MNTEEASLDRDVYPLPLPLAQIAWSRYVSAVKKSQHGRQTTGAGGLASEKARGIHAVVLLKHFLGGLAVILAVAAIVQLGARHGADEDGNTARDGIAYVHPEPGVRLAYERRGDGPTNLVMIHGSPGSKSDFDRLVPYLRDRFTTFSFDMPGFGDSSRRVENHGYQAAADLLGEALFKLGLAEEGVVVLGFSFGGGVAIELAAQFPSAVRSLVLLAAVGVPDGFHTGSYGGEFARTVAVAPVLLAYPGSLAPGLIDFSARYGFWRGFLDSDTRRMEAALSSIPAPALIVHSRGDTVVGPATAVKHDDLLSNSRLVWYEGGHGLIYQQGELLSRLILDNREFLIEAPSRPEQATEEQGGDAPGETQ